MLDAEKKIHVHTIYWLSALRAGLPTTTLVTNHAVHTCTQPIYRFVTANGVKHWLR